ITLKVLSNTKHTTNTNTKVQIIAATPIKFINSVAVIFSPSSANAFPALKVNANSKNIEPSFFILYFLCICLIVTFKREFTHISGIFFFHHKQHDCRHGKKSYKYEQRNQ